MHAAILCCKKKNLRRVRLRGTFRLLQERHEWAVDGGDGNASRATALRHVYASRDVPRHTAIVTLLHGIF